MPVQYMRHWNCVSDQHIHRYMHTQWFSQCNYATRLRKTSPVLCRHHYQSSEASQAEEQHHVQSQYWYAQTIPQWHWSESMLPWTADIILYNIFCEWGQNHYIQESLDRKKFIPAVGAYHPLSKTAQTAGQHQPASPYQLAGCSLNRDVLVNVQIWLTIKNSWELHHDLGKHTYTTWGGHYTVISYNLGITLREEYYIPNKL